MIAISVHFQDIKLSLKALLTVRDIQYPRSIVFHDEIHGPLFIADFQCQQRRGHFHRQTFLLVQVRAQLEFLAGRKNDVDHSSQPVVVVHVRLAALKFTFGLEKEIAMKP